MTLCAAVLLTVCMRHVALQRCSSTDVTSQAGHRSRDHTTEASLCVLHRPRRSVMCCASFQSPRRTTVACGLPSLHSNFNSTPVRRTQTNYLACPNSNVKLVLVLAARTSYRRTAVALRTQAHNLLQELLLYSTRYSSIAGITRRIILMARPTYPVACKGMPTLGNPMDHACRMHYATLCND